jgi:hypothetical protein
MTILQSNWRDRRGMRIGLFVLLIGGPEEDKRGLDKGIVSATVFSSQI